MRKDYDFSKAKRASNVPHLQKLQQSQRDGSAKTRITIMLDNDVLASFRERAESQGVGYQTLINSTLKEALAPAKKESDKNLTVRTLRKILREELDKKR